MRTLINRGSMFLATAFLFSAHATATPSQYTGTSVDPCASLGVRPPIGVSLPGMTPAQQARACRQAHEAALLLQQVECGAAQARAALAEQLADRSRSLTQSGAGSFTPATR